MTISLKTVMENLPPEQRARIEKRAAELIAEERTLQKPNCLAITELHGFPVIPPTDHLKPSALPVAPLPIDAAAVVSQFPGKSDR